MLVARARFGHAPPELGQRLRPMSDVQRNVTIGLLAAAKGT